MTLYCIDIQLVKLYFYKHHCFIEQCSYICTMQVKDLVEYLNTLPQDIELYVLASLENGDYKVKKITWLKILQESSTNQNILIVENE